MWVLLSRKIFFVLNAGRRHGWSVLGSLQAVDEKAHQELVALIQWIRSLVLVVAKTCLALIGMDRFYLVY
jgi:hypothetical protein